MTVDRARSQLLAFLLLCFGGLGALPQVAEAGALSEALDAPDWLVIRGEVRARYQGLQNQIRPALPEPDHILALRSLLDIRIKPQDNLTFGFELQDSRILGDDEATALSTGLVNTAELLRAYASWTTEGLAGFAGNHTITAGRMTLSLGRSRLIGRNGFRNTINAFTGIHYQWVGDSRKLDAFWVLPVDRLPRDRPALADDAVQFDRESFAQQLWALHYERSNLPWGLRAQVYLFGLHERDSAHRQTRNRRLYTPGFALFKAADPGEWFVDLEMSLNLGTSRASASPLDMRDLDHFGYTAHAEVGYRLSGRWTPMLLLQFDIASGDAEPDDNRNGQYDTLFGPKRLDFGHTDIYGAFARENIIAPAVAVHVWPSKQTRARIRYQPAWLEEARDGWPDIGVRDVTGQSGRFIGHQIETRFTWTDETSGIQLGAGTAFLFKGRFARTAPNANPSGDVAYTYADVTVRF